MKPRLTVGSHSHIVIILLSAILGAAIAGVVLYYPQSQTPAQAQTTQVPEPPAAVTELETAFVNVAERTLPAVVSIRTEVQGEAPGQMREFRDFFRDFPFPFGPFTPGPEQEQEEGEESMPEPTPQPRARGMGAGWIYSEDGYIVTNSHVVRGADEIVVKLHDKKGDDTEYEAKLIGNDPKTELAVIKIEAGRKLPTLTLGSSDALKVGQWVMAVGAPFHLEQTFTAGIVSAKGRFLPGKSDYIRIGDVIQTDAAINPGNSGGPLVNIRGEVVGINVAILSNSITPGNVGIGFAVPADTAKRVIPELIEAGKVARGWLGIGISEVTGHDRDYFGVPEGGVVVESIKEDGPASRSELKEKDVITAVDDQKVTSTWDLQKAIASKKPGSVVTLHVVRNRKPTQVKIKLGEMPAKYQGLAAGEEERAEQPAGTTALGITVKPLTPEIEKMLGAEGKEGVAVVDVDPDGPAFGKIAKGSIITEMNRQKIASLDDFNQALDEAKNQEAAYVMVFFEIKVPGEDEWQKAHVAIEPEW